MTWDSHGDIDGGRIVQMEDDGDMRVSGKIDGSSYVYLRSRFGSITVDGKIDGSSTVILVTSAGSITIGDRIDGSSNVTLRADTGAISLKGHVDGHSRMNAVSNRGAVAIGDRIDGSSTVRLMSRFAQVSVGDKIDGTSLVSLSAGGNIQIGGKIDGSSQVKVFSGGTISLGDRMDGESLVDFQACGIITIGERIDGGAIARLSTDGAAITVKDKIDNGATAVTYWPANSLTVLNGVHGNAKVVALDWPGPNVLCDPGPVIDGQWWQNWPQSYGYVIDKRFYPRGVNDIAEAITSVGADRPIKAVGAGWSFTDAALPFKSIAELDRVSTLKRGAARTEDMSLILRGLNHKTNSPMDLLPEDVADDLAFASHYDQATLTQKVQSGWNLPGMNTGAIIDTTGLAASLQSGLQAILSPAAKKAMAAGKHYFHVEAGITLAAFEALLDRQHPRLALKAAGAPAATLAGAIATGTHGAEFRWPLMVDTVRAIHLVGPGGEEWWIEGNESIANYKALQKRYPKIDRAHFIAGHWKAIGGLTAQDVLNAVIVSMGAMGVVYSIVLEVYPQYGIQQIIKRTTWASLANAAGVSTEMLAGGDPGANNAMLRALLDGSVNGTGIGFDENVYANLAINPFNLDCWITNRRFTPTLPVDANGPSLGLSDYLNAVSNSLGTKSKSVVFNSALVGRVLDFLNYDTDIPTNLVHLLGDANSESGLVRFLTQYSDLLTVALATVTVQAVANAAGPDPKYRSSYFLGDLLTGALNAIQGTIDSDLSDHTDISSKSGSVGWGSGGIPGRGLEIAIHPEKAFSFVQRVLIDEVMNGMMIGQNKPLIGYMSVRVCQPTNTLMGMQQFAPFTVMVEIVGYRSPEANAIIDEIQRRVIALNATENLQAMLHWGLENHQLTQKDLQFTPVILPLKPTSKFTRLSAFQQVRQFLRNGNPACFDNYFVQRLGL